MNVGDVVILTTAGWVPVKLVKRRGCLILHKSLEGTKGYWITDESSGKWIVHVTLQKDGRKLLEALKNHFGLTPLSEKDRGEVFKVCKRTAESEDIAYFGISGG